MYYLIFPDGSKLFQTPFPEDFVYHCLLLAIDKGLCLRPVKVLDYRGLYFFRFLSFRRKLFPFPVTLKSFGFDYCCNPTGWLCWRSVQRLPDVLTPSGITGSLLVNFLLTISPVICYIILVKLL